MNTSHHVHVPDWMKRLWENPPDPVVYIFPSLANWDMRTLETALTVVASTFIVASVVFILSYVTSYRFVLTFRARLRTKEKVFWCLAFVRALFGFVASFLGFWYLAFDNTLHRDVVKGHTQTSFLAVYISVGFFIFECLALFSSNIIFRSFDPFLAVHHSLSLIGFSMAAYYGNTHFFAIVGLLLEMTTPFTCFCWMLLKAGKADTFIWQFNQLLLVHLFHCRTTIEGFFFYKSYYQWTNIYLNMPLPLKTLLYTQLTLQFFILTPYWTYKKMGQLYNPVDWNFPDSRTLLQQLSRSLSWSRVSEGTASSPASLLQNGGSAKILGVGQSNRVSTAEMNGGIPGQQLASISEVSDENGAEDKPSSLNMAASPPPPAASTGRRRRRHK